MNASGFDRPWCRVTFEACPLHGVWAMHVVPVRNPFVRGLSKLSVGRKLLLIYLLDLCAVIFVSGFLVNEKYLAIDFAQKEIHGNAYIRVLLDAMVDAALLDTPEGPELQWSQHLQRLQAQQEVHGEAMNSAILAASLQDALLRAAQEAPKGAGDIPPQADASSASGDELLARGRALLTRLGNQSNLILDPDLGSYYTMSLEVLRVPELMSLQHRMAQALEPAGSPLTRKMQYLVLEGQLDGVLQGIRSDWAEAVAARPTLSTQPGPQIQHLLEEVEGFRRAGRRALDIEEGRRDAAMRDLDAAQRRMLTTLRDSSDQLSLSLERLLHERVQGLYRRMALHLGMALVLLICILGIVYLVAQQIRQPLRRLSAVFDTVARTGDHTQRAMWQSEDEIGRLVRGFNDMLGELDQSRQEQQELVSAARASQAQKVLLEATPVAMLVTGIPGHEVLHANAPAEYWLNGSRIDPWAFGLEPAARARFFQQLADWGAVDEFEVLWHQGSETTWAVLSARRLSYQGQDAVLTSLTSVNHLKLMERRLELWAKVFEVSSEGIVIVDADRRLVSANAAFLRSTGQELSSVRDLSPGVLFEEAPQALAAMWAQVQARGHWQGEFRMRRRMGPDFPAWVMVSGVSRPLKYQP